MLEQAREALAKNDLATAVIRLKNAARADPENMEVRLELGRAALRTGDYSSAEKEFERAMQGARSSEATLGFGDALVRQGKFDAVLAKLTPGGADPAVESAVRARRGAALLGLNRIDEAIDEARRGIAVKDTADAEVTLARALQRKGDAQGAGLAIEAALRLQADLPDALLIRAQLRAAAKDLKAAEQLFDRVLLGRDDWIEARLGRASIRLDQGNQEGALADLDAVLKRQPKFAPAIYFKALAAVRRNDAKAAQDFIDQLPSNFIDSTRSVQLLAASVALSNGKLASADALAARAHTAAPQDPAARQLLGAVRLRGGKPLEAIALLEPLTTGQDGAALDPLTLRQLGQAYLAVGKTNDAVDLYQRALAKAPNDAGLVTDLATTEMRVGRTDAAIQLLEGLLAREPTQSGASLLLLNSYLRQGAYQKARDLLPTFRTQLPNSPAPDYYAGVIAQQSGDIPGARSTFEGVIKRDPTFLQASFALAALEQSSLRPEPARQALLSVLTKEPGNERAMNELSALALSRGKRDEALDWLQKSAAANPKSIPAKVSLINGLIRFGDAKTALTQADEAARQSPGVAEFADRYGAALVANGRVSEAATHYRSMIQRYPDSAVFQARLAATLRDIDPPGAERALRRAVEIAPTDIELRATLIQLLIALKQPDQAIAAARDGQNAIGAPNARRLMADAYRRTNRLDQLRSMLEADFARDPTDLAAAMQLADLSDAQGAPANGTAWLAKAVAAAPQAIEPRLAQIDRLVARNELAQASAALEAAAKQLPGNPDIEDRRGRLMLLTGKAPEGVRIYRKLAEGAPPGAATPQQRLAEALLAAGDPTSAINALKRAVEIAPRDLSVRARLANVLVTQRQPDAAMAVARQAAQELPGSGSLALVGETEMALGRFDDAAKTFADIDTAAPSPQAMSRRLVALFSAGKEDLAIAAATGWSTRFPDDQIIPFVLADRFLTTGRGAEATAIYERLLIKAPNDPRVLNNLAWALQDKDPKRAAELADRAYQAQPSSAAIADTLAVALNKAGDHARAVEISRQAVARAPLELKHQLHLAEALAGAGDKPGALAVLRTITEGNQAWSGREDAVAMLQKLSAN